MITGSTLHPLGVANITLMADSHAAGWYGSIAGIDMVSLAGD